MNKSMSVRGGFAFGEKKILKYILKLLAGLILKKYKPQIIGITGSVGKTSAKEAILVVLSTKFLVRGNQKNYNNEIGLPLTIINAKAQGKSIIGWFYVFAKALKLILINDNIYPKIIVLEMGVDRPGDIDYFKSFIPVNIGVITMIGSAHIEFFGSKENIQKEKGKLIDSMDDNSWAILNFDNVETRELANKTKAKILTFGFDRAAMVNVSDLRYINAEAQNDFNTNGVGFIVNYQNISESIWLPKVVGKSAVYAALTSISVGLCFDMSLVEIANSLKKYTPPLGRMNLIKGKNNTLIFDDTYNSSPQSLALALEDFSKILKNKSARKLAVLGDMLELGVESANEHRKIGRLIVGHNIDFLVTVGKSSVFFVEGAIEAGFKKDNIFRFDDSAMASEFLYKFIKEGDVILAKGSQGARMEKVVEKIIAEPELAGNLLVRQGKEWKK